MQNHRTVIRVFTLLVNTFVSGCANTYAPNRWLSDPDDIRSEPYGGWIRVECTSEVLSGELVAICHDSVFVADSILHATPQSSVMNARLVTYYAGEGIGAAVFLGTLSTISNGWFLVFTAPMWLIGGTIAASSRSYAPIIDFPESSWEKIIPFARYPQGLPLGIDRDAIRMKPRR